MIILYYCLAKEARHEHLYEFNLKRIFYILKHLKLCLKNFKVFDFGRNMRAVLYHFIVTIFCVCSINGSPTLSSSLLSPNTAVLAKRHDGNDYSKLTMFQPPMSKSNANARSGQNNFSGLVVNNEFGQNFTNKMKLKAKISPAEFDEINNSMVFKNYGVSKETVKFYNEVLYTLKQHLFDCLQVEYNRNTIYTLSKFIEFVSIDQNLLNDSIALLLQSRLDITQLMKLYFYFCGPFQEPVRSELHEYSQRIRNIQNDMNEKFKDIIGDEPIIITYNISHTLHVNKLHNLKKETELKLFGLATSALKKIKPYSQSLPGTPLHFICIGLLKWTTLMTSDNEDAVEIQNTRIIVENTNTSITMRQYADGLRYEINIRNLGRFNYEMLLRVNNIFLHYLYKHFVLSANLINTNIPTLKTFNKKTVSLVIARIYSFRPFLEIFNLFFVTRYLDYVGQKTSLTKLTSLIYFTDRFNMNSDMDLVHAVQELQLEPERTVKNMDQLLKEFTMAFLQDLNVEDRQKWIDDVDGEVIEMSADISSALKANKNKAQKIMALCVKDLNFKWPNTNKVLGFN